MTDVRELLLEHGLDKARQLVLDKAERQRLDIAAAVMAEEEHQLGICHAGFALTSLPHKDTHEEVWRKEGHRVTLLVESGRDRQAKPIGIPYGSKARMILIYLQTQAVRTSSREVELGRSMKAWMTAMGMGTTGGATYRLVTEQARRIGACRLTFFTDVAGGELRTNGAFVENEFSLAGTMNDNQPTLWQECVRLNEAFYRSLIDHPVPVSETALRHLANKSMAIDVYIWTAYRLHALTKTTKVSWPALFSQFGSGFALLKHFKPAFIDSLKTALAAYPDARIDVEEAGVVLHPSRPPIAKARERIGIM
ncbi:pirin [Azospirillum sp. RWY-5-1]|uniref:Pirin n=1 Tax=Azospirillum oleiclasticum TaxID=2735135 RepID=A0ABX2TAR8_9PROT|nr:replication protein RepA [Azospirillum oleiclasticum]NYZ12615.1 pirin [Azospirillum oleiclasticum]NYZ19775.1 pirin [Azospirillum oleiclasticum]